MSEQEGTIGDDSTGERDDYELPSEAEPVPYSLGGESTSMIGVSRESHLLDHSMKGGRRIPVLLKIEGAEAVESFIVDRPEVFIGRETDCRIVFPNAGISRKHARMVWENFTQPDEFPICRIYDLGSRNGTALNGKKVSEAALADGDRVIFGDAVMGFFLKDEAEMSFTSRLLNLAKTDALTGLANRLAFQSEAERAVSRARRYGITLSLAILDIDFFKKVNDTYGHVVGDGVLRRLAEILRESGRITDFVGRLGGEEFGILMPDTSLEDSLIYIRRLHEIISATPYVHENSVSVPIAASIGVATLSGAHSTWTALYEAADGYLYEAKRDGRNCIRHQR
ncbi:hypothetical protein BH09SUM1_BH09SUM1_08750 [soil metagenome]